MALRILLIACAIIQLWITLKNSCHEAEAVEFKMTNLVCETLNKSWMVFHKCRLRAVSRNKTCMYLNGTILHPAYKIHTRLEIFQKANGYKPWLINTTVDVCRFLRKPFNPVAITIAKLFIEFSNFNHTCPYLGPQIVDGFYLRYSTLPHGMPTGEYLLSLTWHFDLKPQFITNIYFKFTEDLKADT
ncbi:uncharacterized protein LOC108658550 [Drosophila navojoa]|uniref:uncharacterized protein LOC108658550 n=1 Tax=Drosophila navojoa TaxID=7232 RepID=UPI0011BE3EF1|nr:uncharacterized protein LOC108658550 [Drosophila navojoa]